MDGEEDIGPVVNKPERVKSGVSIDGWRERLLLNIEVAAAVLSVSRRSVRRLISDGTLQLVKVRGAARVRTADVLAYGERITGQRAKGV